MGRLLRLLLLVIVAIALFACDKDAQQSPAAIYKNNPAAVKRGKLVFAGTCGAYCHMYDENVPYMEEGRICLTETGGRLI